MNEPIHKNCIAERDWLRREYERLTAENAKYEAARKVADAAVAVEVAMNAGYKLYEISRAIYDAEALLADAEDEAYAAFNIAITEYRELTEPVDILSRPAVEKAFATVSVIESNLTEEAAQGVLANARRMADGEC